MIKRKRTRDHSHVRRNTAQEMEMEGRSEREEGKGGSGNVFDMRNHWYPVVFASELPRHAGAKPTEPYGFQLLGDPIVLFRDEHGAAQCVQDKCPHRSAPLSVGTVRGGRLECKVRSAVVSAFFSYYLFLITTNFLKEILF
jgi:nitrite reductase/ring-hydroxylating ferredoxin subunit